MSPRAYNQEQRRASAEETRARIIAAARGLLAGEGGFSGFTIDAVARQADVARMTIYYQFNSKIGLLEAVCDSLAFGGGMAQLARVFRQPDPRAALLEFVSIFAGFWEAERVVIRRLRALAALDAEIAQVVYSRDERRRLGAEAMVERLVASSGTPAQEGRGDAVTTLYLLTSFETFDTLAGATRTILEMVPAVQRLACLALGLDGQLATAPKVEQGPLED